MDPFWPVTAAKSVDDILMRSRGAKLDYDDAWGRLKNEIERKAQWAPTAEELYCGPDSAQLSRRRDLLHRWNRAMEQGAPAISAHVRSNNRFNGANELQSVFKAARNLSTYDLQKSRIEDFSRLMNTIRGINNDAMFTMMLESTKNGRPDVDRGTQDPLTTVDKLPVSREDTPRHSSDLPPAYSEVSTSGACEGVIDRVPSSASVPELVADVVHTLVDIEQGHGEGLNLNSQADSGSSVHPDRGPPAPPLEDARAEVFRSFSRADVTTLSSATGLFQDLTGSANDFLETLQSAAPPGLASLSRDEALGLGISTLVLSLCTAGSTAGPAIANAVAAFRTLELDRKEDEHRAERESREAAENARQDAEEARKKELHIYELKIKQFELQKLEREALNAGAALQEERARAQIAEAKRLQALADTQMMAARSEMQAAHTLVEDAQARMTEAMSIDHQAYLQHEAAQGLLQAAEADMANAETVMGLARHRLEQAHAETVGADASLSSQNRTKPEMHVQSDEGAQAMTTGKHHGTQSISDDPLTHETPTPRLCDVDMAQRMPVSVTETGRESFAAATAGARRHDSTKYNDLCIRLESDQDLEQPNHEEDLVSSSDDLGYEGIGSLSSNFSEEIDSIPLKVFKTQ